MDIDHSTDISNRMWFFVSRCGRRRGPSTDSSRHRHSDQRAGDEYNDTFTPPERDRHSNRDSDGNTNADPDPHTDEHSVTNRDSDADRDTNTNPDGNADTK